MEKNEGVFEKVLFLIRVGLAFSLLGLLIGAFAGNKLAPLDEQGYFIRWRRLVTVPAGTVGLSSSQDGDVYVRTENGDIYRWRDRGAFLAAAGIDRGSESERVDPWIKVDALPLSRESYRKWEVTHFCLRDQPAFSFFSGVPGDGVECVQDDILHDEFITKNIFMLDKNGVLWGWEQENIPDYLGGFFYAVTLAVLGSFLGLFFGFAWVIQGWVVGYLRGKKVRFPAWWEKMPAILRLMIGGAVFLGAVGGISGIGQVQPFFWGGMVLYGAFLGLAAGLFIKIRQYMQNVESPLFGGSKSSSNGNA